MADRWRQLLKNKNNQNSNQSTTLQQTKQSSHLDSFTGAARMSLYTKPAGQGDLKKPHWADLPLISILSNKIFVHPSWFMDKSSKWVMWRKHINSFLQNKKLPKKTYLKLKVILSNPSHTIWQEFCLGVNVLECILS